MASVTTRPNGHRWVTFKAPNGKRQTLRLGAASLQQATTVKEHVEKLLVCHRLADSPPAATIEWLAKLADGLHDTLAKCGLVNPRGARTVGALVAWYIAAHPRWKKSTITNLTNCGDSMIRYFGRERKIVLVTPEDAAKYREWLDRDGRVGGGPLGATTASVMCRRARTMFAAAAKKRWIPENPFAELKGWIITNPERDEYIKRSEFDQVAKEMAADTRLFFSLIRFAGLRGFSEIMPLEWTWVDWHHRTLFVKAPKTARYEGQESRFVPLSEELYELLRTAFDNAPEGSRFVFGEMRITNTAIDNRLEDACRRAEVIMWPKPKINMRASCEFDWLRIHPLDMVAAWMGHSPETMLRHYNRVFKQQAAQNVSRALQPSEPPAARAS